MDNPYRSPVGDTATQGHPVAERFARSSDWLMAIAIFSLAIIAGIFGFASGIDQLPWQQSPANTWQSIVCGVIAGVPSAAICYFIANMLTSGRKMVFVTWAITAPLFPAIFSHVLIGTLASC